MSGLFGGGWGRGLMPGIKLPKAITREAKRRLETAVETVSPAAADTLRRIHDKVERAEDVFDNYNEANDPDILSKQTRRLKDWLKSCNPGDHLYVARPGFTHHGLYVGQGQVIHYLREEGVVKTDADTFATGSPIYVMGEDESPIVYSPTEAISRAQSRLGEQKYNLLDNNCEHFVRWCRYGRR
ncbi:MAG TPA: lecithin retinol acyltransferase family protein [Symbiobacteriaceae bacterium]|nr:lecithin retinol acyltransferase family protein [Symbiobacteriaceae bacterium]